MIAIRTKTEKSYDKINPLKTAKIIVEMVDWSEKQGGAYYCTVNYYAEIGGELLVLERRPPRNITPEVFNMLHAAVSPYIPEELTAYEKRELRKKLSLLAYVQSDTLPEDSTKLIFGTIADDWELY